LAPSLGALILIWDAQQAQTLKEIYEWKNFIEEYQPPVLLCVQHSLSEPDEISDLGKECEGWCLENGFESISVNLHSVTETPEQDSLLSEKEGVERIIEALEANIWPNIHLKNEPFAPSTTSNKSATTVQDEGQSEINHEAQTLQTNSASLESAPSTSQNPTSVSPPSIPQASTPISHPSGGLEESLGKLSILEKLDFSDPENFEQLFSILQPIDSKDKIYPTHKEESSQRE